MGSLLMRQEKNVFIVKMTLSTMITFTANGTMLLEDLGAADGAHKR